MATDTSQKVYMIRRRSDGLYSSGSSWPVFRKNGKMWSTLSKLKQHLSNYYYHCMIRKNGKPVGIDVTAWADMPRNAYVNCDVVEAEVQFAVHDDVFRVVANKYIEMQEKEEKKKSRKPRKPRTKKV